MTIWRKLWKMGWLICAVQRRCALCWTFAIAQEMPFNLSTYPETEQEYEMRRKHMSWRNGYSWEILLVFPIFSSISFICISQTESRCKYHFSFCTIIYKHRHKPTLTIWKKKRKKIMGKHTDSSKNCCLNFPKRLNFI